MMHLGCSAPGHHAPSWAVSSGAGLGRPCAHTAATLAPVTMPKPWQWWFVCVCVFFLTWHQCLCGGLHRSHVIPGRVIIFILTLTLRIF